MKFEELDKRMRVYEVAHDHEVLPGVYMVARIDGRCFTHLTKNVHPLETPYDTSFRDMMIETSKHVFDCGFRVLYGYTQSDEINLLLHPEDQTFNRKLRKLNSVLAGEASAKFSLLLGAMGVFDCRISQLPRPQDVVDYLRWRHEDACRNALNSHCYWALRDEGLNATEATQALEGHSNAEKNEILFQKKGLNFNDLPNWQKRGIGLYWENQPIQGIDPRSGATTQSHRKAIKVDWDLPMKEAYNRFIEGFLL